MCSLSEREDLLKRFANRPQWQSADAFSKSVGVHYTTLYKWARDKSSRDKASAPTRSEGFKAVEASLQSAVARHKKLIAERDTIAKSLHSLEADINKLEQALELLS